MREILFSGKSLYDNEWIEGFYVHANEAYGENIDRHFIIKHGEFEYDNYDAWEVIPETVGQYTGLTDKNGKKIFEGDIVRVCLSPEIDIGVVKFDERIASFIIDFNPCELGTFLDMFLAIQEVGNKVWVEVIGNIHDNPELLEVDDV